MLSLQGTAWMAALTTPFDAGARGARVVDGNCALSAPITATFDQHINAAASGVQTLQFYPDPATGEINIASYAGTAPTATTSYTCAQHTALAALTGAIRPVGMGLHVFSDSPADTVQGSCHGGLTPYMMESSAGVWRSTATMKASLQHAGIMSLKNPDDGIKVRWQPADADDLNFFSRNEGTQYTLRPWQAMPCVVCEGMATAQDIHVEAIVLYEYQTQNGDILTGEPSPLGLSPNILLACAARLPVVASGHSFLKYLQIAGHVIKIVSQIALQAAPYVAPLVLSALA